MRTYYFAGGARHPGTTLPSNVTGDCPHQHRTPLGAERCIARLDASIKRGHGPSAYCDRIVMVHEDGYGSRPYVERGDTDD